MACYTGIEVSIALFAGIVVGTVIGFLVIPTVKEIFSGGRELD